MDRLALRCPDGCGLTEFDMRLEIIEKCIQLEKVIPMTITSGIRCPKHNKEVGGAENSLHLHGMAIDFVPLLGVESCYNKLVALCRKLQIKGVRIYEKHIHVDARREPHFWRHSKWRQYEQGRTKGEIVPVRPGCNTAPGQPVPQSESKTS